MAVGNDVEKKVMPWGTAHKELSESIEALRRWMVMLEDRVHELEKGHGIATNRIDKDRDRETIVGGLHT